MNQIENEMILTLFERSSYENPREGEKWNDFERVQIWLAWIDGMCTHLKHAIRKGTLIDAYSYGELMLIKVITTLRRF